MKIYAAHILSCMSDQTYVHVLQAYQKNGVPWSHLSSQGGSLLSIFLFSKLQLVVYYQCCVLIGWATTRLYVIAH